MPPELRAELIRGLHGTLPIFAGGVFNTIAVSLLIVSRNPTPLFIIWLGVEIFLCLTRLTVLLISNRAACTNKPTPTDLSLVLSVLWAAGVGYGAAISVLSGDWVAATLACMSAAAMVGGICFRNFAAPRLVAVMILLSLGPCAVASALSGEPIMLVVALQIPFYLFSMTAAAFKLNRMLIATMLGERENDWRARHDVLTGLCNRAGLVSALEARDARKGGDAPLALYYMDLDGFKTVNDQYGHAVGDVLLSGVAERLRAFVPPQDVVARIGGDEFVILSGEGDAASAKLFAERMILQVASAPYVVGDGMAFIGASVGIALRPEHGRDLTTLLHAADGGLYRAKAAGKSRAKLAERDAMAADEALLSQLAAMPMDGRRRRRIAGRR